MTTDYPTTPNVHREMASARMNLGRAATYIGTASSAARRQSDDTKELDSFRLRIAELVADMLIWRDEQRNGGGESIRDGVALSQPSTVSNAPRR